ncbi:MAG: M20/M25/M40 family metallo-hydrolase [Flavobacteriales bacterium]|nr:M20/M25/M40 family metallo-hydrolase [Flavobacteriales bacterium]
MVQFITEIVTRFGGRYFGSEQEKNAQIYTKEVLEQYCDTVELMPFDSALEAHFQALKLFCVLYVAALAIYFFNVQAAAILASINAVLFVGHFVTYRHWLDFLWKKKTSHNVIGDIEPTDEVQSTLIFAGHIDSVKEFKWWYKLKYLGVVLTVVAGFLFPLLAIFLVVAAFVSGGWAFYGWLLFAALTPILIVYFDMHGKEVVHGVNDNLTGVAMAVEMAKVFSAQRLQHTRIRCISFGSEEAGLRGAHAYGKTRMQQLLDEKALLINLDSIKDLEFLTIGMRETNTLVTFDPTLIDKMDQSFKALGVAVKKIPIDVGASDASAFRMLGLPALSLIGMRTDTLDPTYHTRLDNLEHLDGTAMEAMKKVLIHFVTEWDK